jgi:hypothetical protein
MKKFKINKFYFSDFYLTEKNDYLNIIINIFFSIKLLINYLLKIIIITDIVIKKKIFPIKYNEILKIKSSFEECYIISSGPSINNQDLKKLNNKITFVSNDFHTYKDFKLIRPTFYCLLDGGNFNPTLNREGVTKNNKMNPRILERLKKINFERSNLAKDCTFILPLQSAKSGVEKYNFFPNKKIIYLRMLSFDIADFIPNNLEINAGLPFSFNVLPWKICLALLMGFKKIYLIGAEQDMYINNTHFLNNKDRKKDQELYLNAFDQKYEKNKHLYPNTSNYISMYLTKNILKAHMNLKNFSEEKNAKIINLTPGGILDVYDTKNFDDEVR